jgi:histidine kinase-like protein
MLIGAAVLGAFTTYVWQRRTNAGAKGLMVMLAAGVVYMATYALELSSSSAADKHLWGDLKYLGICLLPAAWLVFTLQYTGRTRWLTPRLYALLSIEPAVVLLLLSIPGTRHLVHVFPAITEQFPVVRFGLVGWLNLFYSYGILVFSTGLFVRTLARIARPYRNQARTLIVALLVPFAFNILYNFNIGPFGRIDLTGYAFFLAVVVLVWGIFRVRLLDILPVARSRIVETMQDGVVVLDARRRNRSWERRPPRPWGGHCRTWGRRTPRSWIDPRTTAPSRPRFGSARVQRSVTARSPSLPSPTTPAGRAGGSWSCATSPSESCRRNGSSSSRTTTR